MCEHKQILCKLIQNDNGHHREDYCKECKLTLTCKHFDLKRILDKDDYKARKNVIAPEEIDFDEFYSEF